MVFADAKTINRLREQFPVGCRVVLDEMDDPYTKIPVGAQGVCRGVDDTGNILVSWDCGSSLSVAYGADSCHRVATEAEVKVSLEHWHKTHGKPTRCPRCGKEPTTYEHEIQALSRRADIPICNQCGMEEGLEDWPASGFRKMGLSEWHLVKEGWKL